MSKKIIIVLVACGSLAAVGVAGMWYYSKSKNTTPGNVQTGHNFMPGEGAPAGQRTRMRSGNSNFGFVGGKILGKDDASITVQTNNGGSVIALYSAATKITKIVDGQASDLAVGQTVTARGTKNEDGSISVDSLQIRPQGIQPNRQGAEIEKGDHKQPAEVSNVDDRQAVAPQNGQDADIPGGANSGFVNGQITAVGGNRITVKSFNGNEQAVVLADGAKISKLAEAAAGDLTEGTEVSVTGSKNADGSITAQMIQIGAGFGMMNRMNRQ